MNHDGAQLAIETKELTKRFGELDAVDGIDLDAAAGPDLRPARPERLGQDHADPAARRARPADVRRGDGARRRGCRRATTLARIGYMTQADGIYAELSVWENLRFFAALTGPATRPRMRRGPRARRARRRGGTRPRSSCRAACAAGCRWPARWSIGRRSSSSTSRRSGIDPALRVQFWGYFRAARRGRHDARSSRATSWTRPTAATSCCYAARQGARPGHRRRRSASEAGTDDLEERVPAARRDGRGRRHEPPPDARDQPAHRRASSGATSDARPDVRRADRDHRPARLGHPRPGARPTTRMAVVNEAAGAGRADRPAIGRALAAAGIVVEPDTTDEAAARDALAQRRRSTSRSCSRRTCSTGGTPALHVITPGIDPADRGQRSIGELQASAPAGARPATRADDRAARRSTAPASGDLLDAFAPALVGFFVFFLVFILTGISFLRERIGGTLERLLATPVRRSEIVSGYSLGLRVLRDAPGRSCSCLRARHGPRRRRSARCRRSRSDSASPIAGSPPSRS